MIRPLKRRVVEYKASSGKKPFAEWLLRLKDRKGRAVILRRIGQAEEGNFGTYRDLRGGLLELKVNYGLGYRIYFGLDHDTLIVLLCGGDKGSQVRDIEMARKYWADYKENLGMPRKATDFDETLFKLLRDPEEAAAYLNEHLEYKGKDRNALFLKALRKVALAQGMDRLSSKTKLTRRSLEKALSEEGNPRFSTLSSLLEALGLHVSVEPKQRKAS